MLDVSIGLEEDVTMSQWKVGIIGLGHVGAHVLQSLALQGYADDFVLYDLESNRAKAEAERQDVLDCMEFLPHRIDIKVGGIEDLADRDVIVNAVGDILALKGTHDRNYELKFNMHALYTYAEKLKASGFHGIVVNISNPCDVITWNLSEILGLPAGHVFGTGTGLDTARLKLRLQQQTGLDAKACQAYMIGEHGNAQIAAWSAASFNGQTLAKAAETDEKFRFDQAEMEKSAREGGWTTYNGKFCTEYAIALTACRLVHAVEYDEKLIVPVSTNLAGAYGEERVFAGVPAVVGRYGVEQVVELPLDENDKKRFHDCCDGIRANYERSHQYYL